MAKETYAARCGGNVLITPRVYEARIELVDPPEFHFKRVNGLFEHSFIKIVSRDEYVHLRL